MATKATKPVAREVYTSTPDSPRARVIVTIYPGGMLGFREVGRRIEHKLSVESAMTRAIMAAVDETLRNKPRKRSRPRLAKRGLIGLGGGKR